MAQSRSETSSSHSVQIEAADKPKNNMTIMQSIITGSVAGAAEVLVDHPLWTIKTRLQRGEPFTLNLSLLYRGILPNVLSMVPITAMQVTLNTSLQKLCYRDTNNLSSFQRVASAFVAGVASAFVTCPTEMVMTYQGSSGGRFTRAFKQLVNAGGWGCLLTGLPATAIREGLFAGFFLAGTPILKSNIKAHCSNDYVASLSAGICAGIGAAIVTQAFDTIKTVQQSAAVTDPIIIQGAIKKLYSAYGVSGFFKGSVPRGARMVSGVTIMSWVNEKMEKTLSNKL